MVVTFSGQLAWWAVWFEWGHAPYNSRHSSIVYIGTQLTLISIICFSPFHGPTASLRRLIGERVQPPESCVRVSANPALALRAGKGEGTFLGDTLVEGC